MRSLTAAVCQRLILTFRLQSTASRELEAPPDEFREPPVYRENRLSLQSDRAEWRWSAPAASIGTGRETADRSDDRRRRDRTASCLDRDKPVRFRRAARWSIQTA